MLRDVSKGLDPKRDEQETSCTAGDKLCRGRQVMPQETRYATGGGLEAEGMVKQSGLRGFPLQAPTGIVSGQVEERAGMF